MDVELSGGADFRLFYSASWPELAITPNEGCFNPAINGFDEHSLPYSFPMQTPKAGRVRETWVRSVSLICSATIPFRDFHNDVKGA
jgi:hypothetical protein